MPLILILKNEEGEDAGVFKRQQGGKIGFYWRLIEERKKYFSRKDCQGPIYSPTVQPRHWCFRFWSAGEAKTLECLAPGKEAPSLIEHARLVLKWRWQINFALKVKRSGTAQRRGYPRCQPIAGRRRGYFWSQPVSIGRRGYSSLEAGLKSSPEDEAEFNHQGEAQIHIPMILFFNNLSNSKYFEIWIIPL